MVTQICIWSVIILVLSIIFIIWVYKMMDNITDYDFYDAIVKTNNCFIVVSILFSIMVYRTIKYTTVIIDNAMSDNFGFMDALNVMFSFVSFVVNVVSFIMVVYLVVGVYKDYYFDKGTRYSTPCSFKTLKIINRFSNLETRYTNFYYIDKNGDKTLLRFNFPVFLYVCYYEHFRTNANYVNEKRKKDREKETKLYKTLINDIEKIRKENKKEAERCMKKAADATLIFFK